MERRADGSYIVNAGSTLMASRAGVVAEVKTREGDHIKYVAKTEDSTKVAVSFLRTATSVFLGWFANEANAAAEASAQLANTNALKLGTVQSNNTTAVALKGLEETTQQKALEVVP